MKKNLDTKVPETAEKDRGKKKRAAAAAVAVVTSASMVAGGIFQSPADLLEEQEILAQVDSVSRPR